MPTRVILSFIGVAVLAGLAFFGWNYYKTSAGHPLSTLEDLTAKVERHDIVRTVSAAGDIEPETIVEVKAEVGAKILKLHAELGQKVKEGQLLVELDDKALASQRDSSERDVQEAKLKLASLTRDFERTKDLYDKNLVSLQAYQTAQTDLDLASNDYQRILTQLAIAEDRLSKTRIRATCDGTILERAAVEGQIVVPAESVNSGTVLMTIADLSKMIITTHINQVDIMLLKNDMPVAFTLDSLPDRTFTGTIYSLAPDATVKNNVKGFEVKIRIINPDPLLRPGMTANVVIPVEKVTNVLTVPLSAVFVDPDGKTTAYVKSPGNAPPVKRDIEVGLSNLELAEIKSGLKEHETVLLTRPTDATP